ncbi:CubicO group peptidase (beta-lactamase class C family) [Enterococcus sp. PF1-24]|uniref:serine hydrolase domain-containing protein n=1 Tax=unclassified Enterococcus TaxID=2608891 RepID=UPI002475DD5F|nr:MULTISPECIES: serine hydrolase domain-containing protein [unclassified Enterococcus]MDH6365392.1 CubicO group peptidase (beta-lactamase class C family) [Enterococcus sp. PFB1-1]MDH6402493.1 CubicO group peptidase (beta-lactamase class C family) [Enterococcus sp. PF1-24]
MYLKTQALIEEFCQEGVFSGVAYQFISPAATFQQISGLAQTNPSPIKLTSEMLFDVASLTKVVCTTTILLKLLEAGEVELDQALHYYLPAFKDEKITLRHLLTHTSDIQTYIPNRNQLDKAALRAAYYQLQPGDLLGKKVQYTDAGTILLGFMLEEIYQEAVVDIFQKEVLQPLNMSASRFLPTDNAKIVPTEKVAELGVLKGITHDPKARVLAESAGNAGLFTNLADLHKFVAMLLAQGQVAKQTFLQAETVRNLLQDYTLGADKPRSLGWDLLFDLANQQPILYHTGYTGTFLVVDILAQEAFIFLSNRVHPTDRREEYLLKRDKIIASYLKEKAIQNKS